MEPLGGEMNEITAEATVDIDASPSEVWRSLTDPARLKQYYLGAEVEVTLDEREGATRVALRQSNLEGGATDEERANRDEYEKNWKQMLDVLKKTTER